MQFSLFGQKFTRQSGILQLMDDLGRALNSDRPVNMLGGGNPAQIKEINQIFEDVLRQMLAENGKAAENICNYSTPQGDARLIDALVRFFNRHYGWQLTAEHIALTNGSQNAFFYLFNLFGGRFADGDKSILLPLAPEYVGYADVHTEGCHFTAVAPKIETVRHNGQDGFFKYRIDFDALEQLPALREGRIGAICCSRPTNPSGNVLTDEEMARLDALARQYGIPLIVDNAYGMPFPNIIYSDTALTWNENTVLCFSLSKIGLPGVRCGIVVACPQIIRTLSSLNAIVNLAPTRWGAAVAVPLLEDDRLKTLSDEIIRPFYRRRADLAVSLLKQELDGYPMRIHKPEGAIFLWVWFEGLPVPTQTLYEQLKAAGTLIIPGEYFFIGTAHLPHTQECIRLSIAADENVLRQGIAAIGAAVRALYDGKTE